MANGNQRRDIRDLLRDEEFLKQNLKQFGMDQNTLPFAPAGALRRVVGGGLLNSPGRVGATSGTSVGFPRNAGSGRRVVQGETVPINRKALPAPSRNRMGDLLTMGVIGGTGLYNLFKGNQDDPVAVADEVPVGPGVDDVVSGGTVVPAPTDSWQPPGGLQTGLDFIKDRRNFYIESMSGALGKAAILNLMEKGAGDSYLKDIQGDIEQEEVYKDDEYLAKINKAIFSKPYKNSKEIFDRLVKAQIPVDIASKITGYIPKTKMVNFINPVTEETYLAPEDSTPREGFRRVDPTLDKTRAPKTYETSETIQEAIALGGEAGVAHLARWLFAKGALGRDSNYDLAVVEARKMLAGTSGAGGGKPKTREEAEKLIRASKPKPDDVSDEEYEAAIQKLLNEKY